LGEGVRQSVINMKFLLYCFEWLSGLNINYHKSEVVTFGVDNETKVRIANMMNCQIGSLPIKYFGFPISDKRLACGAFKSIIDKMRNTLQPWRGGGTNFNQLFFEEHAKLHDEYVSTIWGGTPTNGCY
jgi:hypothetical protein